MCFADEVLHACGYLYLLLVTGSISGSNQGPIKVDSYNHDTGEISKEPFYGIDMFHCSTLLRFGSLYSLDVLNEKCSDGDPFAAQLVPTKSLGFFLLWFPKWSHSTRYGHSRISEGSGLNGTCPALTLATRMLFSQRICSFVGANKGARGDQKPEIEML